jgi:xanthine dehydrogenase YagS FAD-binding subunit
VRAFEYVRAESHQGAVDAMAGHPSARFLGSGTNLVDHLKLGITSPERLVDVSHLPLDRIAEYDDARGTGLCVGANVRNSDLAAHPLVRASFPVVARALLSGASGQIRNQATTAGNLLQRTRCVYFQDVTTPCNKRDPGSGCSAKDGYGRYNAVLGASESCVTTHPSDLAVALATLEPTVVVLGPAGERRVPYAELHRLPGDRPELDTTLAADELILELEIPFLPTPTASTYRKVRDRASFAFALVSVAAALHQTEGVVRDVRLAWGGVAHKPWRAERAEEALVGRRLDAESVAAAVDAELVDATAGPETAYKLDLVRNTTVQTLLQLAEEGR